MGLTTRGPLYDLVQLERQPAVQHRVRRSSVVGSDWCVPIHSDDIECEMLGDVPVGRHVASRYEAFVGAERASVVHQRRRSLQVQPIFAERL